MLPTLHLAGRDTTTGLCPPVGSRRQLIQCDKAAWGRLASCIQDIRQDAAGHYLLGVALLNLRRDPYIALYLSPVAKASASSSDSWNSRSVPYTTSTSDRGGKAKGKGKKGTGKGSKGSPAMPRDLHGKWHRTPQGDAICFGYNTTAGCNEKGIKAGERCKRGLHVCPEPKCQQHHSLQERGK